MSIPDAMPSQVPQWIYSLSSQMDLEFASATENLMEAGFYATLNGGRQNTVKLVNWIRETSIAYVNLIQHIFNAASAVVIILNTTKLVDEVLGKFKAAPIQYSSNYGMLISISVILGIALTKLVMTITDRFFTPSVEPGRIVHNVVQIGEKVSFAQKSAQVLHSMKLVLSVALACFAKNKVWLAISLASLGYSILKNAQLKWITFSRIFPTPYAGNDARSFQATYNMLTLPPNDLTAQEVCTICYDEDTLADTAFCANHVFHRTCLEGLAINNSDSFMDDAHSVQRENRDGMTRYSVTVPESNFPACPNCREVPQQNHCEIEITDRFGARFNASVNITRPPVDRQYLFENIYAIYNTAQTALTYLQTYPELAGAIFQIQRLFLVTDFIGYAFTAYYLNQKINARFNPENTTSFKIAVAAAFVGGAVLSYFAVLQINAYLRSAIVLKNVLTELGISPEMLQTIEIDWNSPLEFQLMQTLQLNRIISSTALVFFSDQWKTNMLSVIAQSANFIGISQFKWIEFSETTYEWPVKQINTLKNTSHFLIDPSGAANPTHLSSIVQSIYKYTTSFFNDSRWELWAIKHYRNGTYTHTSYLYEVVLRPILIEPCANIPTPAPLSQSFEAIHKFYGKVAIKLLN
jgi:hypothetical protein